MRNSEDCVEFPDLYSELFYMALKIRLVEEKIIELYPSDKIQSPVHLSIGQEAVAVGICHSLELKDLLFCSYRSHAFFIAKGGNLRSMFAELCGKVTGCNQGKAGSMHLAEPSIGLMGSSAVVASTISHAIGASMAAKILKKDQIIVSVFGDGATDEGVYHESLNFAALHKLPVIFICENNGLAVHSRPEDRQAFNRIEHAGTYGLPVTEIRDGYDFVKVHEIFSDILDEHRRTGMPHFIEIRTFRYKEHVGVNDDYDDGYRSIGELDAWKAHDPLELNRELVDNYTPAIMDEIDDAVEFAENSPWPGIEHLLTDVT